MSSNHDGLHLLSILSNGVTSKCFPLGFHDNCSGRTVVVVCSQCTLHVAVFVTALLNLET